jgi:hypothetical protein
MNTKTFPKQPSMCHCTNMRRASRAITQFYDELLEPSGLKVNRRLPLTDIHVVILGENLGF